MARDVASLCVCGYTDGMLNRWARLEKMNLTDKQEKFCQKVVELSNNSEAYRCAYDTSRMKDASVHRKAKELMDNVKISARLEQLRMELRERYKLTVDDLIKELEEARQTALSCDTPQTSAAVSSTMGKAKLLGLDKQVLEISGPNGAPIQTQDVPDEELEAKLKALGLGRYHNQLGKKKD